MMISYIIGIYILVCALVGTIGIGRQIGFFLSFVIALLTTPVVGLIVTVLSNKNTSEINSSSTGNISDELLKLNELKEKGVLTEDEFVKQKNRILN